jgi:CheY-like chemotaxis protein
MKVGQPQATKPANKVSILLMDANSERRALRKKILALHGIEVVGASDLAEATSIWHRDRYNVVLLDIRMDHHGCLAWRDEIKKEKPQQIVAFLVGKPTYVELDPLAGSYVAEEHGMQWGDSLRDAIRKSCDSLPQRNGLIEAGWRIAAARKLNGGSLTTAQSEEPVDRSPEVPAALADN